MGRQELIDATIDYVITQVAGGRSVGPAYIKKQEREVIIESILEAFSRQTVRSREHLRRHIDMSRKVGRTGMKVQLDPGMYAKARGEKLAHSFPRGLTHKALGKSLHKAAALRHAIATNPKRRLPK